MDNDPRHPESAIFSLQPVQQPPQDLRRKNQEKLRWVERLSERSKGVTTPKGYFENIFKTCSVSISTYRQQFYTVQNNV